MEPNDWQQRSELWREMLPASATRKRRERSASTLVLCGHGIALRVEAGTLLVKNGFTHYPQEQEAFRYFRGDLDRPARIVVLDGSGHITFDVLDWLAEQDVPLIRVSWNGEVITVAGGTGYGASREKVEWQRATRADNEQRLAFGCDLIRRKVQNSIATLRSAIPESTARDRAIHVAESALERLSDHKPATASELYGVEGPAAAAYFEAWQGTPLKWRESKRRPIPEKWRFVQSRASMLAGKKSGNRNASHPINAMLNYAYAVAIGQLKLKALADGYDPTIGIMHHKHDDAPAFVLDLIEPMRPVLDQSVLHFAKDHELHPADFLLRADGACRLTPQLARRIVGLSATSLQDAA